MTGGSSVFKGFLDSPPEFIPDQIRDQNDGKRNCSMVLPVQRGCSNFIDKESINECSQNS
jgi:hypothetical protein